MIIFWGKKRVEQKIGMVAEFCPICRDITPFQVTRIGMAGHVYYITFSKGQLMGHTAECQVCHSLRAVDALQYLAFEKQKDLELETLIQKTFPNIREVYAVRLILEETIKQQLKTETLASRETLLLEPFQYLADQVEELYAGNKHFDRESGTGCLGTILFTVLLFTASIVIWKEDITTQNQAMLVTIIIAAVGSIYTVTQLALVPKRFLHRKIIVNLARSLKPLNPSREELVSCLGKLKRGGFKIGTKVSLERLWETLQTQGNPRLK